MTVKSSLIILMVVVLWVQVWLLTAGDVQHKHHPGRKLVWGLARAPWFETREVD